MPRCDSRPNLVFREARLYVMYPFNKDIIIVTVLICVQGQFWCALRPFAAWLTRNPRRGRPDIYARHQPPSSLELKPPEFAARMAFKRFYEDAEVMKQRDRDYASSGTSAPTSPHRSAPSAAPPPLSFSSLLNERGPGPHESPGG